MSVLTPSGITPYSLPRANTGSPIFQAVDNRPQAASIKAQSQTSYSQAIQMVGENQIHQATIQMNPDSWAGIPKARLEKSNGEIVQVNLPRKTEDFEQQLHQSGIPYAFEVDKPVGLAKVKEVTANVVKESLVPILLFGLTSILGTVVFRYGRIFMERNRVQSVLKEAVKGFREATKSPDDILQLYPQDVQHTVNRFRHGRSQGVILIGPPGNGKTYLLESVAKEFLSKKEAIALDLSEPEVRSMLSRIYSYDGKDRQAGLGSLNRLAGKDVKHILLVVDEFERYWPELSDLFTKSVSNGSSNNNLPKLHPLLSGNDLPALTEDAAESRIGHLRAFVDHLTPQSLSCMVNQILGKGSRATHPQPVSEQELASVFERNPGYSVRRVMDALNDIIVKFQTNPAKDFNVAQELEAILRSKDGSLTGAEMAGLARRRLIQRVESQLTDKAASGRILTMYSFKEAETLFRDLGLKLNMSGYQVDALLSKIEKTMDFTGPMEIRDFITKLKEISERLPNEGV